MNENMFAKKISSRVSRSLDNSHSVNRKHPKATDVLGNNDTMVAQRKWQAQLNYTPRIRSQIQLQHALRQSPRSIAQAQLSTALQRSSVTETIQQLKSDDLEVQVSDNVVAPTSATTTLQPLADDVGQNIELLTVQPVHPSTMVTTAPFHGTPVIQRQFNAREFIEQIKQKNLKTAQKIIEAAKFSDFGSRMIGIGNRADVPTEALLALQKMTSKPTARLALWQALSYRQRTGNVDQAMAQGKLTTSKTDAIKAGIFEDTQSAAEALNQKFEQGSGLLFWDIFKNQEIERLDKQLGLAREMELKYGVSIRAAEPAHLRDQDFEHRGFSVSELKTLEAVLSRLPPEHVKSNPFLEHIRRQPSHPTLANRGAEYGGGERRMNVFDGTFTGPYRVTGEYDSLSGHAGMPVTAGEEALTHEIGHSVEKMMTEKGSDISTRFQALGGWESFRNDDEFRQHLMENAMDSEVANTMISTLNSQRGKDDRTTEIVNGHEYMVNPDNTDAFYRRRLNRMPGDELTPELPGATSHVDYARTSPHEQFAELYAHIQHVPERTYVDHVLLPKIRTQQAEKTFQQAKQLHKDLWEQQANSTAINQAYIAMRQAEAQYKERIEQQQALTDQWDIMRREVFGVTPQRFQAEVQNLRNHTKKLGLIQTRQSLDYVLWKSTLARNPNFLNLPNRFLDKCRKNVNLCISKRSKYYYMRIIYETMHTTWSTRVRNIVWGTY